MNTAELVSEDEMSFDENHAYIIEHLQRIDNALQLYLHRQHESPLEVPEWLQIRLEAENSTGITPTKSSSRLGQLTARFSLNDIERDILLLALLPHFDPQYAWQFSSAQHNKELRFPSLSFTLNMLAPTAQEKSRNEAFFLPGAPLLKHDLVHLENLEENDRSIALIKVDIPLYHYLIGYDYLPPLLDACAHWIDQHEAVSNALPAFSRQLSRCLARLPYGPAPRVTLKGPVGDESAQAASTAAAMLGMPSLLLNLDMLAEKDNGALHALSLALREVQLRNGCLLLQGLSTLSSSRPRIYMLFGQKAKECRQPIITLQGNSQPSVWLSGAAQIILEMPVTSPHESLSILSHYVDPDYLDNQVDLEALSKRFHVPSSSLVQTLEEAELYRRLRDPQALLNQGDLVNAFKRKVQQNFGDLATRIQPARTFNDLMVPDELRQQLNEVLMAIRHREHAIQQGFGQKLNYGLGISTLFHGPSGAGKTMAAEVIASTLNVDLIKVDLSAVVNKFIGETEKQIARIFDLAARDSGILFFDEADALFGKRSETKDAQDRYANIEVSYLLQRLETHDGPVILSTNNLSHLDNAFTRRLTFIIRFLLPDIETRARMWRSIWPQKIRIANNVDFHYFARIAEVSGANIRNIALLATWLATEEGVDEIDTRHIRHALQREMIKTGQITIQ
ncbi:ATP-binding protein [Pseudomonas sp. NFIX28]|uniref:ATP-binding protein n=1 Tax=Pseudomonas sp. NFIX28 TaxID=1566235 RepID=UPI000898E715|nr:ATP-binding protein [Pseudomonas sp. NFIX28]SDY37766.1 AAA+-type ATPase, SpoVK/Ycf46/Vps4 family [Pseudomonas sp. NFIX28]